MVQEFTSFDVHPYSRRSGSARRLDSEFAGHVHDLKRSLIQVFRQLICTFWRLSYLCASLFFGRVIGFTGAVLLCPQKELRLGSGREVGIERVAASAISPSIKPKVRSTHRRHLAALVSNMDACVIRQRDVEQPFRGRPNNFAARFYRSEVCSKNLRSCI